MTKVLYKSTEQKYYIKVLDKSIVQKYLTKVLYKSTWQKYYTKVLDKSTVQSTEQKYLYRSTLVIIVGPWFVINCKLL